MLFVFALAGSLAMASANAIEADKVAKENQSSLGLYFTAKEAYAYLNSHGKKVLFLDVRDPAELQTVGMPTDVDANVPFKRINLLKWDPKKKQFALDTNPNFVAETGERLKAKGLNNNDTVIIICGSGLRAPKAADTLAKAEYTKVYVVVDGYKGWQADKLPWSREMDIKKMYGNPVVPAGP
jgi:rhodanese-related sulfurtransferase